MQQQVFTIAALHVAYAEGVRAEAVIEEVFLRLDAVADPGIFLHLAERDALMRQAAALGPFDPARPLWGIPMAIKDNIDVEGMPTTAACPAFAYTPTKDAFVVAQLRAAGALIVGKTNLDQFATGLNGTRTPFAAPKNALDPEIVPGGSSSGSAVAVAHGIVAAALGTDTAGSGRVPAALNNIVGLKPSLGALSARGVVPACRTLDAVSVFALTVADAYAVFRAASAYDAADPYARKVAAPPMASPPPAPRVAIPEAASLVFAGDSLQEHSFRQGVAALQSAGAQLTEIDLTPFQAVAALLYDGPWIAERHTVVGPLLESTPEAIDPAVRAVIAKAESLSATDAFRGHYRLAELRREIEGALAGVDVLCLPSIPGFCTLAEIAADPLGANARLGTYTNFVNLLGFCALAVPLPTRADGRPASVTLVARHGHDATLAALALALEAHGPRTLGATGWAVPPAPVLETRAVADEIEIAVCGAHMSGLALNAQLTERGGRFLRQSETLPEYRLYRLPGGPPVRPGLVRTGGGAAIAVEVWALPLSEVGGFLTEIPSPLGLATVALADGTTPKGFLCEHWATVEAEDVTAYGNWRAVTARLAG